jgi:aldose 1-epimerase
MDAASVVTVERATGRRTMAIGRSMNWAGLGFIIAVASCGGSQDMAATPAAPAPTAAAPTATAPQPAAAVEPAKPAPAAEPAKPSPIAKASWGTVDGKEVNLYTLTNANGLTMKVTNYGGIITELWVPDKAGKKVDVVLGYDKLDDYTKNNPYFGAIIGRVANRIKDAKFKLEGKDYKLEANNGKNSLHGGKKGWDKVVWDAETMDTPDGPSIKLTYTSKDGEEGYPGTVKATNVYTWTNKNELKVEMSATTDKTTIVNMAHHSYWNLAGHDSGSILEHEVTINADKYTPGDPLTLVVGGQIKPVKGTPWDFTKAKPIGKDLKAAGGKPTGFDANWIVNGDPHTMREAVRFKDPKSGRVMVVEGDQPGVQFYSGNFLDGSIKGKGGVTYNQYQAICVETQKFPNSVNVPAWQKEVILKPGDTYKSTMVHKFSAE